MKHWLASLILLPLLFMQSSSSVLFVAPYGAGDGTVDNPASLQAALSAGGSVWLLPGVYKGTWLINTPVTLRSVPGTRARLDGDVKIHADDVTLEYLEITNTSWLTRTSVYAGSPVSDLPQSSTAIEILGKRARILHNYIHDLGLEGIGAWSVAGDTEIAYNLIFNNGWRGSDRGHGPAIYAQNKEGEKWFHDNVLLPGYNGATFEIYGSSAAYVKNFRLERNIHIGGRHLVGAQSSTDAITITNNLLWGGVMELGYTNPANGRAIVQNNYIGLGRIQTSYWKELLVSGNTIVNQGIGPTQALVTLKKPTGVYTYTWDANTYYHGGPYHNAEMLIDGVASYSVPSWKVATGYDASSGYSPALPTTNHIVVRSWGPHRGVVTVFNWTNQSAVSVDLSPLALTPGASYRLVNAQNIGQALPFTAGTPVSLPMGIGWSVALPYAASTPLMAFDSRFATFLVEPN